VALSPSGLFVADEVEIFRKTCANARLILDVTSPLEAREGGAVVIKALAESRLNQINEAVRAVHEPE
jgi:hypothetical protein